MPRSMYFATLHLRHPVVQWVLAVNSKLLKKCSYSTGKVISEFTCYITVNYLAQVSFNSSTRLHKTSHPLCRTCGEIEKETLGSKSQPMA